LRPNSFNSRGFAAILVAAVASSLLAFAFMVIVGIVWPTGSRFRLDDLPATIAIVAIWAPAFALIPAGILGLLVERPKARAMIKRPEGRFIPSVALSVVVAALISFLLRIVLHLINPMYALVDLFSLGLFTLIGLCSGVSWWFLVVVPGRRV
jgi:hypothetical protein